MDLYGYCIMTSHIHMIIGTHQNKMENIVRDMKTHTYKEVRKSINEHPTESRKEWMLGMMQKAGTNNCNNKDFQLWQQDNHPVLLKNLQMAHQKLNYTHYNPVEAGIVEKPEDYLYSSARNYDEKKGLIEVVLLDPIIP